MAFIGNTVQTQGFSPAIDYFNGNGVTVTFTLSRPVASVAQMIVAIDNVIQNPSSAFNVSGSSITFTSAPLSGTNNIWVEYTSLITTYAGISQDPSVIGDITATGGYLSTGDFGNSFIDGAVIDYVTGAGRITVGELDNLIFYHGGTSGRSELMKLSYAGASTLEGGLSTTGSVGVGTASPPSKLSVKQSANSTTGGLQLIRSDNSNYTAIYMGGDDLYLQNTANGGQIFYTNNTERMRITSGGNVVINSASAQLGLLSADIGTVKFTDGTPSAFLNWRSNQATGRPCIQVQNLNVGNDAAFRTAAWNGSSSLYWTFGQNINSAETNFDFCYASVAGAQTSGSGTCYVRFTNSGQVYNTSGTYGTISDIKLKENIVDATPKLASLMQLKVRNFTLKADETKAKQLGFIAQEVQEVFPACVEAFDDIDPDTKEKTGETLTVKTAILIPMLVKAIQEQQDIIKSLTARIAALEAK